MVNDGSRTVVPLEEEKGSIEVTHGPRDLLNKARHAFDSLTVSEQEQARLIASLVVTWFDTAPNPQAEARRLAYLRDLPLRAMLHVTLPFERE